MSVSKIGCGLIRIGRKWGITAPNEPAVQGRKEALEFLEGAVGLGVTFFDTAPAYGASEEILGEFLRNNRGVSQSLFIATKCGEHFRPDGTTFKDYSPEAIRKSAENSLTLLGGHINLLQIHSVPMEVLENEEALRALEDLKDQGDVDSIGISCTFPPEIVMRAVGMGIFSAVQVPYNFLNQNMEQAMRYASDNAVKIIINRPLATGLLSPKNVFAEEKDRAVIRKVLSEIGDMDLARYSWDFILKNPHISTILTGTGNLDHLRQNLEIAKLYGA